MPMNMSFHYTFCSVCLIIFKIEIAYLCCGLQCILKFKVLKIHDIILPIFFALPRERILPSGHSGKPPWQKNI